MSAEISSLPQSPDALEWRRAKQMVNDIVHSLPPSRRVFSFIKGCATQYAAELTQQIRRLHQLFQSHLPRLHEISEVNKSLKTGLLTRQISHEALPVLHRRLSQTLPPVLTLVEEEEVDEDIQEAGEKLDFVQELVERLPQHWYNRDHRTLAKNMSSLVAEWDALHSMHQTVGEVRQLRECTDTLQNLEARRQALLEELERSSEAPIGVDRLREMENEFDRLFLDLTQFEKSIKEVHEKYPELFTTDFENFKRRALENDKQLQVLLKPHRTSPVQDLIRVFSRNTFVDLLRPDNIDFAFMRSMGLIYAQSLHPEYLAKEYETASVLSNLVLIYKRVERALIQDNLDDFFALAPLVAELSEELGEEEIKGLKTLFATRVVSLSHSSTVDKKRLVAHIRFILHSCPPLSSPAVVAEVEKFEKRLPPSQVVPAHERPEGGESYLTHARHEQKLRSQLTPEIKGYLLMNIRKLVEENRLEELTLIEIDRFRRVYSPDFAAFQKLISDTLTRLRRDRTPLQEVAHYIAYVQQFIALCPELDREGRIRDQIAHIFRFSQQTEKVVRETRAVFSSREPPCERCMCEKIASNQFANLTRAEVAKLRIPTNVQAIFLKRLRYILDSSTRANLLEWKREYFDPFLAMNQAPSPLQDVNGIDSLVQEMNYRLTPPNLWAWICVLLGDLLRMLRN